MLQGVHMYTCSIGVILLLNCCQQHIYLKTILNGVNIMLIVGAACIA